MGKKESNNKQLVGIVIISAYMIILGLALFVGWIWNLFTPEDVNDIDYTSLFYATMGFLIFSKGRGITIPT